jgi:carboxypeptidase C (cathepsin A)
MDTFNPVEIGKRMLDRPAGTGVTRTGDSTGMDAFKNPETDKYRFMEKFFQKKLPALKKKV